MLRFPAVLTLAGTLALAAPALAQVGDSSAALAPGRRAYSFSAWPLEGGAVGGELGIWRVVAPDRSRGLVVALSVNGQRQDVDDPYGPRRTTWTVMGLNVGPHFRRYVAVGGPVAPFLESSFGVGLAYLRSTGGNGTDRLVSPSIDGRLGAGAEWFPLQRVSLSAQTGMTGVVGYERWRLANGWSRDTWRGSFYPFASALALQLYF